MTQLICDVYNSYKFCYLSEMMMKKALVTGASEGIGQEFAVRLAEKGYQITAVARNEGRLQQLLEVLPGTGHSYVKADLSEANGLEKIKSIVQETRFDLLINNAGSAVYGSFIHVDFSEYKKMMHLNCLSLLELSHTFLQLATSGQSLINVSSNAAYLPMPITSVYAATKAFVTALSEGLWYEAKKKNVYVMSLCPGTTKSEFHTRAGGKNSQIPNWAAQTPKQVVAIALKALDRRKCPVVICGPQKLFIYLAKLLPRSWVIEISGFILEKLVV